MHKVLVRPARREDYETYAQWVVATRGNAADPDPLTYKSTSIRCAFDINGPLVFMPVQRPLHMESLAVRPGASEWEVAAALWALFQDTVSAAYQEGSGEIYFAASEETVPLLAGKRGFEELPYRVFRVKLKDLEHDQTKGNKPTPGIAPDSE